MFVRGVSRCLRVCEREGVAHVWEKRGRGIEMWLQLTSTCFHHHSCLQYLLATLEPHVWRRCSARLFPRPLSCPVLCVVCLALPVPITLTHRC